MFWASDSAVGIKCFVNCIPQVFVSIINVFSGYCLQQCRFSLLPTGSVSQEGRITSIIFMAMDCCDFFSSLQLARPADILFWKRQINWFWVEAMGKRGCSRPPSGKGDTEDQDWASSGWVSYSLCSSMHLSPLWAPEQLQEREAGEGHPRTQSPASHCGSQSFPRPWLWCSWMT